MDIVITLIIVLVLFLVGCFVVMQYQVTAVQKRETLLKEAFFARWHRIPILLEVVSKYGLNGFAAEELIVLRARVSSDNGSLTEITATEQKIIHICSEIFRLGMLDNQLKTDALFLSLQRELQEVLEQERIALNDYNFELQKLIGYGKLPFLKIFEIVIKSVPREPLKPI